MNIKRLMVGLVVASFFAFVTVAHADDGWVLVDSCIAPSGDEYKVKDYRINGVTTVVRWGVRNATKGTWVVKNVIANIAYSSFELQCADG